MLKTDSYSHSSDVLRHLRMFSAREIAVRVSAQCGRGRVRLKSVWNAHVTAAHLCPRVRFLSLAGEWTARRDRAGQRGWLQPVHVG
jgi:hypothetical protein